ncbi:homoserine O-acetyltransferase [Violaceomyces palustris]|uniref:Homoserine O-acetyltransferase n=1 Tax=Violaceomyces palustris TaxID=1673888 RepID=A0ACD0NR66_9BASI|nr:homoserine O-acetyltransferase [Violaceomyces palustris]
MGATTSTEIPGPTSPQSNLLTQQRYLLLPTFTLESGITLKNLPVAFKTWGKLDPIHRNNALLVCHALTGSADVEDWWGPLLGTGKLFDPTRFLIVCANVLGSPYGSASPCTKSGGEDWPLHQGEEAIQAFAKQKRQWDGRGWWGPEFPPTTVRDDVRIQKLVLDYLGVEQIAAVVGGSMGGMAVIEWPLCFPVRFPEEEDGQAGEAPRQQHRKPYIRAIVPLATSARHSAWGISWVEAQRQSIYSDPAFQHGYYSPDDPPRNGLSAARMAALLTYRSRDSFESRFGRRVGNDADQRSSSASSFSSSSFPSATTPGSESTEEATRRRSVAEDSALAHNEGNLSPRTRGLSSSNSEIPNHLNLSGAKEPTQADQGEHKVEGVNGLAASIASGANPSSQPSPAPTSSASASARPAPKVFSAQSYLRYQGDKFVKRFDANCYVHLTRKMDTHDVARGRWGWKLRGERDRSRGEEPRNEEEEEEALARVLSVLGSGRRWLPPLPPSVQIVSIESDGLFAPPEQRLLHQLIPGSELVNIKSPDGHDGFLLEFEQINEKVGAFLREKLGDIYQGAEGQGGAAAAATTVKESVFGEVEDVTRW